MALPALGALVTEPLMLLADSAIVGRLGTVPLAGLGLAGAVLGAAVSVFVVLAYGTTASVARLVGAGHPERALAAGTDGLWTALGIGAAVAAGLGLGAPALVAAFGPEPATAAAATTYLRVSAPGTPAMLVVLAAIGVLRGLRDTHTTFVVAVAGTCANAVLNVVLVHGLGAGVAGAALGTVIAQWGMAAGLVVPVVRRAREAGVTLHPRRRGITTGLGAALPLLVRTVALRGALLATTSAATGLGPDALAAHQVAGNVWTLLAMALDALAIACQALTAGALGAGDLAGLRSATGRALRWGIGTGVLLGTLTAAAAVPLAALFGTGEGMRRHLLAALLVAAVAQPLAGCVFVLDGVLIGAGDGRFLAVAGLVQLAVYLPGVLLVERYGPDGPAGLAVLWAVFALGYMSLRALFLVPRSRGTAWMVTGARR